MNRGLPQAPGSVKAQFLGDLSLNGEFASDLEMCRQTIESLSRQLEFSDVRIVNWESPIEGSQGVNMEKGLPVTTTLDAAERIPPLKINVALLANNHIFDCLESGFERTISFLHSHGVATVGAGFTAEEAQLPLQLEVNGVPLVVLSYVDAATNPAVARPESMFLNIFELGRALDEVGKWAKLGRTVLVCIHWGREYLSCPSPSQRKLARKLMDSGASVVACHHPHRLQGHEQWKQGHIFYSLGNFLFGSLYPGHVWPRACSSTMAVSCDIEDKQVVRHITQHFTLRNGVVTWNNQRPRRFERQLNKPLKKSDDEYRRYWSRALVYHNFLFRPAQFVRQNPYPWNWLSRIGTRHIREYWGLLKTVRAG